VSFTKHIFRPPSPRPYQVSIWHRLFISAPTAAADVGSVISLPQQSRGQRPRMVAAQQRAKAPGGARKVSAPWLDIIRERTERYAKLHRRDTFDVREVYREVYGTTPAPPDVGMVIQLHTQRPRVEGRAFRLARLFFVSAPRRAKSFFAKPAVRAARARRIGISRAFVPGGTTPPPSVSSHVYRHPQLSHEVFRRFRRARRLKLPVIQTVAAAAADIGWLVSYIIKNGYGHNLRR